MRVTTLKYSEYEETPQSWALQETNLGRINLVVGKNAAGKSRFINVLAGLARLITGEILELLSGTFDVRFENGTDVFQYHLRIVDKIIQREFLDKNGCRLLDRTLKSKGTIQAVELDQRIEFAVPDNVPALRAKRDSAQHPFLEDIHEWASGVRTYQFGTSLGKERVVTFPELAAMTQDLDRAIDYSSTYAVYLRGDRMFGTAYDEAILSDLRALGYPCTAVGVHETNSIGAVKSFIATLYLKEEDLLAETDQLLMSQGMYRALALSIHLNFAKFAKHASLILIDDIGEGLDFERSSGLVKAIIQRAEDSAFQLIMTTNDRFVMNGVPVKYWNVLHREKNSVRVFNQSNSPESFNNFETYGLNNFDFFARNLYDVTQ